MYGFELSALNSYSAAFRTRFVFLRVDFICCCVSHLVELKPLTRLDALYFIIRARIIETLFYTFYFNPFISFGLLFYTIQMAKEDIKKESKPS